METATGRTRAQEFRTKRGLTLQQAADLAGVAERTLRRIEHGYDARYSTLERIAALYRVSPEELREARRPTVKGDEAASPSKGA